MQCFCVTINVFLIYLMGFATEAAVVPIKRIERMTANENSLGNVRDVGESNTIHHYSGRERQCIDTQGGLKCQNQRRIRGPPRRKRIYTEPEKAEPCSGDRCPVAGAKKKHESAISITDAPLYVIEKQEIGVTENLPEVTSKEMVIAARDNKRTAIKYRSIGNEGNPALSVEEVKGETEENKLLVDQSPQADGDDDYGQAQEEMTENDIKSSREEVQAKDEQLLRSTGEETLTLTERRRKRKYENRLGTIAKITGKQSEEGRFNNKKQFLVQENESNYEDDKRLCCNKNSENNQNKHLLSSNEVSEATYEDKEYGENAQALEDKEIFGESENAEKQEAMTEDNPSENETHKLQQRSGSSEENITAREVQSRKAGFDTETSSQNRTEGNDDRPGLKSSYLMRCGTRKIARNAEEKQAIKNQKALEQEEAEVHQQASISSNADVSKSSLEGRNAAEEGGEMDEEETLDTESAEDEQQSNDRVSAQGGRSGQKHAFAEENDERNLKEEAAVNEMDQAMGGYEEKEEALDPKSESEQMLVAEQSSAESNVAESENEDNEAVESGDLKNRQVSEDGLEENSKQSLANEQLQSLINDDLSTSENNGEKITKKREEDSAGQAEESEQTGNDNLGAEGESEASSLENAGENMEDEENAEGESGKQYLTRLGNDEDKSSVSELKKEQETYQQQAETRAQRELPETENETPLEEPQTLEQESVNEYTDEQYEPVAEEEETNDSSLSKTENEQQRESREVGQQEKAQVKCCKNNNKPSLTKEIPERENINQTPLEDRQTLEEEENKELNSEQQESSNEYIEEQ